MDTNEFAPEQDRRPHTQLDRHFTTGSNVYRITACGTGDDPITLTLIGWGPDGETVSEISGGISPLDLPDVTQALSSTLAGLSALRNQRKPARAAEEKPKRYPNRGARWSPEDDERLIARYRAGAGERALMEEFGRSRGGIRARLESLGEIMPSGTPAYGHEPAGGERPGHDDMAARADEAVVVS
jgi:hypothetical protein